MLKDYRSSWPTIEDHARCSSHLSVLIKTFSYCISNWGETSLLELCTTLTHPVLTVTVASSPSGTLATMIPMRKMTASRSPYPSANPTMKKVTPRITATAEIRWMKWAISTAMGVSGMGRHKICSDSIKPKVDWYPCTAPAVCMSTVYNKHNQNGFPMKVCSIG